MKTPYVFDEFFASGLEESISPFLSPKSRPWGKNLSLRSAICAASLLLIAFCVSFLNLSASHLFLSLVYFLVGIPAIISAIHDLQNFEINIDILMTLAAFVAILMGSALEGALLLVLFSLSHAMEDAVSKKTRSALHNLNVLAPKFASLIDIDGNIYEKSVREIQIKDVVIVKNGEIIPLDGKIIKGASSLNLVHLTGESLPIPKTVGDTVPAGARNLESVLYIEVSRISRDSTLAKIIQLITAAQEAKPKLQDFLDRFGQHYASGIIILTFIFALILPHILHIPYFGIEGGIYRALAFLIAASPCALIIGAPTAYLSAISSSAKKGILLKGGITLDALSHCSIIAFDKTGTLTTGELICVDIKSFNGSSKDTALSIAYGLEQHVVHPISTAIAKLAREKQIFPAHITALKTIPGSGIIGMFEDKAVAIGQIEYIASKLSLENQKEFLHWASVTKENNQISAALLINEDIFLFQFSDQIRPEMPQILHKMREVNKLRLVMLTGDSTENAASVSEKMGIHEVFSNLRPEDKLEKVGELAKLGNLAMVGDGINDAPALARANVGISMGKVGSATAIDASDVVLLNDDIHLLPWLFSKAHQTRRVVKQNLFLALSVICFATIPALLGLVPLWAAVILHEGGTVLVGLNSLRLLRR